METTADDGSANSLREIIANAAPGSTVTFDPAVFPLGVPTTITLDPTRGPIPITVPNLTINGGTSVVNLDASKISSRIFNILGPELPETIENLTLENGHVTAADPNGPNGGAILDVTMAPLTLVNDNFENNAADESGGAVSTSLYGSSLNVNSCIFSGNSAVDSGGAIASSTPAGNSIAVANSTFNGNKVTGATGSGGAIYAEGLSGVTLQIAGSQFIENTAAFNGGAIYTSDKASPNQPTITTSTFADNMAQNAGGAVAYAAPDNQSSSFVATYSTFDTNKAANGGGIALSNDNSAGTVTETIDGCLFEKNEALPGNNEGGGLYDAQTTSGNGSAALNLMNSTFYHNTSDGYGGGIYLYLTAFDNTTNVMTLTSLTAYQNAASTSGGGLYVDPGSFFGVNNPPNLLNSIIADNTIENPPADGPDIYGSVFTSGYNFVGIGDGATASGKGGAGWGGSDKVGKSANPLDPSLDPNGLQNNGGPTLTIKPVEPAKGESPVINTGFNEMRTRKDGSQLDQRGYKRQVMGTEIQFSRGAYDPNAVVVPQGKSTSSLNSSSSPALAGQPVTFTDEVTGDAGTPTGTVTFEDGNTILGTVPLDDNGFAAYVTSALSLGFHNISAIYSGDSNSASSSTSLTQVISQETSSLVSLASSAPTSAPNQPVTFTATVSADGGGTPTGTVTFMNGDTTLGTATLDATGKATITTSDLALGGQTITAIYSGDATYGSSSAFLTQTVSQVGTDTSVTASVNPVQPGQQVTFTATVSADGGGTLTGTMTFLDGATTLGTGTLALVNGQYQATYSTASLPSGSHTITAVYSSDSTFAASSGSVNEIVGSSSGVNSETYLSSSVNPAVPGQSVTFTANINGGNGPTTGTVTFLDGSTVLGTASVANGQAVFTTSDLALGANDIVAVYSGDSTYAPSSMSLMQQVVPASTILYLSTSANPSSAGQPVTFTAIIDPGYSGVTPTGYVAFYAGTTLLGYGMLDVVNGQVQATLTTSTLGLGTDNIVAVYSGDDTFAGSSASLQQTISS